jgi:outer membrane protein assembly factor BamB
MKQVSASNALRDIFVRSITTLFRAVLLLALAALCFLRVCAAGAASDQPEQLWKHDLEMTNSFLSVAPNGNLYVLESQGPAAGSKLQVYDLKGTPLWQQTYRLWGADAAPIFAPNGTAYLLTADRLNALAPDGRHLWSYVILAQLDQSKPSTTCLAIGPDGTLYSGGAYLYAFHADGTLKWQTRMKDRVPVSCPAFSANGQLFVSSEKGLHRLSADGQERELLRGVAPNAKPVGTHDGGLFFIGHLAMAANNQDNALFALSDEGKLLWQFAPGPRVAGVLFTKQGIVVGGGVMDLLNAQGQILWSLETPINAAPAAASDGTFLGGCSEGADICAYDAKGEIRWYFGQANNFRNYLPTPIAAAANGEVYFVKGTALIALLPPHTDRRK